MGAGLKASLSQLLIVGSNNPGLIAALMGWNHLTGGSDAGLAYPALIAGALGPALLYLALRRFGYERSVSALLGAAQVAAETAIVYSGRVKTYTIDVLIVLGLAMIVPALTRRRWRWQKGVVWVAAGVAVASFSPFALIGVAVGGMIIVLHPASDLRARIVAVGAQEAASLALFAAEQRAYPGPPVETPWRETWDVFLTFHPSPLRFGGGHPNRRGRATDPPRLTPARPPRGAGAHGPAPRRRAVRGASARRHAWHAYSGVFYGQDAEGTPVPEAITVEALVGTIETLPPGITELGCHPAVEADHDSTYGRERVQEVETLCDPRVRAGIDRCGVVLRSFADLAGTPVRRAPG